MIPRSRIRIGIPILALTLLAAVAARADTPAYPFQHEPEKAIAILSPLGSLSGYKGQMTPLERVLARDVQAGRFRAWSPEEAALIASGVSDKAKRKAYIDRLRQIRAQAARAIAGGKTPAEKGRRLLAYLHAGPMAKGYESQQTTLTGILDDGKFNCVSSAVLYNLLAARLGLQVDAVEVPGGLFTSGHVFSRLKDGSKWLVIETTNAKGFNAERKIESSDRILKEAALVAVIWYNRGVDANGGKRYHEAAVLNLLALSLDPTSVSAANNVRAALTTWSLELKEKTQFAESLRVITAGLELSPKDDTLLNNRKVVFTHWADHLAKNGKSDQALAVLDRAAREAPKDAEHFEHRRAWVFLARGEELVEKGNWAEAHDAVNPGRSKLTGKAREELLDWQKGVYLRWSGKLLDEGKHAAACEVLLKGRKLYPKEDRLVNNLQYTLQEWLRSTLEKQGQDRARQLAANLLKQHAGLRNIDQVIGNHARQVVDRHVGAGKYAAARTAITRYARLLAKEQQLSLFRLVTDREARALTDRGNWKEALAVYAEALKKMPGDAHLTNNAIAVWDEQARKHMDRKAWTAAVAVYKAALEQFPDSGLLKNNLEYCRQEMKKSS